MMIIINFKNYLECTHENLKKYIEPINYLEDNIKKLVYFAPNHTDLSLARNLYKEINIISQHVDIFDSEKTTGFINPNILKNLNITYSLYNHSEHKFKTDEDLIKNIELIQSLGINLIVCCESVEEALFISKSNPFAIALEPKELIGSGVSVTNQAYVVKKFIKSLQKTKILPLIGAGISSKSDVQKSIELGAKGILLSSSYVKSQDPVEKLKELVTPILEK